MAVYARDDVLLHPDNHVVVLVDHQSQMLFAVQSHDGAQVVDNALALAKATKLFGVPVVLTTVKESFSGPLFDGLSEALGDPPRIERTTVNAWEDPRVVEAVQRTGRKRVVLAGLWTEVCIAFPALYALRDGYETYCVTDACGGASREAHEMAVQRMVQAGVTPLTTAAYLYEMQRDWARTGTYAGVMDIVRAHQRRFAVGAQYNRFLTEAAPAKSAKVKEPA